MHRNRTWTLDPPEWRTQRNRLLPIEGGDGSTLNLDFTTGVLDPRLTFTRASNATFINSSGYVEWTKSNLWLRSNELANASWTALNVTRVSSTDPNGGNTATEIIETAVNNIHTLIQAVGSIRGMRYTASVYMKKGVNRTVGWIRDNNLGSDALIFYTLTGSGSYSIANAGYGITGSIERVGTTDWYRCVFSITCATGADANIQLGTAENTSYGSWSFLGVVGNSIHVWGAQAEMGFVARPLIVTTSAAKYDDPRFDYSPTNIGQPKGLLIEGQTQNALFYSQDVTQATRWTIQGGIPASYTSVSATGGTAPDNTNTANLCTETSGSLSRSIYQGLTAAAGTYTASVWVKAGTGSTRYIRLVLPSAAGNFVYVTVNTATGVVTQAAAVGTATAASATVTPYPNSWYRIQLTGTLAATVSFVFIVPLDSATPSVNTSDYGREAYIGNGSSFYVWGAQIETGSGASSYIPTGASQVTRNGDDCKITGTNFSSWFNNTEGTCLFVGDNSFVPAPSNFANSWGLISAANSLRISNYTRHTDGRLGASARYLSNPANALTFDSPSGSPTKITTTAVYKTAFALKTNDFAYSANGNTVGLGEAAGTFEAVTSLEFARDGIRNGHIKQFKFFPTRLSNSQLQQLTSPDYVAPTLNLDFLSMSSHTDLINSGLTFSRPSTATFVNSQGYVEYAGANLIVSSEAIEIGSGKWTQVGTASVSIDSAILTPNGNPGTAKVTGTTTGSHRIVSNAIQMNRQQHTLTMWVRGGTSLQTNIGVYDGTNFCPYTATIVSGPGTLFAGATQLTISGLTTAWTKIQVVLTPVTDSPFNILVYPDNNGTSKDVYLWGVQVNPGATAQTYYPTTTTAYHAPRFDYSPTTIGQPRGLLIEGQTANLCTYSNDFNNGAWVKDGASTGGLDPTVDASYSATGPDGASTITRIVFNKTNGVFSRIRRQINVSNATYTMSLWMKANTANGAASTQNVGLRMGSSAGVNCVVTTIWQRFTHTFAVVDGSAEFQIMLWDNITGPPANSETADVLVYGAQLEAGSGASSYIPTGVTAGGVTRTPDLLAVTSATTMGLNTSEGTFFVETELPRAGTTSPAQFGTPYANGSWFGHFYGGADALTLTANWWGGSLGGLTRGGNTKSLTALSYGAYTGLALSFSSSLNGALSTGTMTSSGGNNAPNPATWSYITLGCNATSLAAPSRDNLYACIKSFKYYPVRLTDAQLQSITA
jgi:hypothetical protein